MTAAQNSGNPEILNALIKAGANVNAKANNGETPLMVAAQYSTNPKVLGSLIKAGADVTAKDVKGKTARDYAEENGKKENAAFLDGYKAYTEKNPSHDQGQ
jgi:ankyrin repeat protein